MAAVVWERWGLWAMERRCLVHTALWEEGQQERTHRQKDTAAHAWDRLAPWATPWWKHTPQAVATVERDGAQMLLERTHRE